MATWPHKNKGNTMLLYIAYSFCPAHSTNVLRQKFRYYFITSNGIIIPIQNLIGPVHILKYSAILLYKLLWTRQWAFWSLMLIIYIALIKQSSFQVEATLNSIRVFELFRSLAIQTRQKSPFWCLTQFVQAESRRVNLFEFSWEELSFWCLRRFVPPNNHWLHNSGRQSSLPSKSPSSKEYKQYLRIRTMVWLAPRGFKII